MRAGPLAVAVLLALAAPAGAAAYPDHPIKVVVPYAAGGPADTTARLIFNKVGEKLGQSFLIDNRGGAGGNIGTVAGAGAAPDGYTLTVITPAQIINMTLFASPGYDVARDFAPVSLFTTAPGLLLVNPKLGVSTFAELIALAKSKSGQLSFASQGVGVAPHLMMEMIK
jgi:tripartite-type tricarboxylate transporter receptor subunit TctC